VSNGQVKVLPTMPKGANMTVIITEQDFYNMRNERDYARRKALEFGFRVADFEREVIGYRNDQVITTEALKANAAEIAALKRELNTCKHARVTIHSRLYAMETREEPADYEQSAQCQDCGKWLAIEDIPEDSEVSE
jgi:hypothetical protein